MFALQGDQLYMNFCALGGILSKAVQLMFPTVQGYLIPLNINGIRIFHRYAGIFSFFFRDTGIPWCFRRNLV